jgi:3-oxoacyl-[acyl-carrier-protein] synthase-1
VKSRAVVVGVGARTALSLSAQPTAFLYRASAAGMQASPLIDADGQPVTMCFLPTLDPLSTGAARALELALPALKEALDALEGNASQMRLKLWLCIDEPLPDDKLPPRALCDLIARRMSGFVSFQDFAFSSRGPASLGHLLDDIVGELDRGNIDAAVVGGVHSDYDPARIAALSAAGRLFTLDRLDGVIPGECAAFVVLMSAAAARARKLTPRTRIHAWATTRERARPDNDAPAFEALALTYAVRQASEALADLQCGWLLTDLSFETMRHYELQAMSIRTQKLWCEPQYVDVPAQRLGNLGAAALPLHLVLASEAWRRGWAPHARAMALAGSDNGDRAVLLLSAPS